jgi:hypothetical protein
VVTIPARLVRSDLLEASLRHRRKKQLGHSGSSSSNAELMLRRSVEPAEPRTGWRLSAAKGVY